MMTEKAAWRAYAGICQRNNWPLPTTGKAGEAFLNAYGDEIFDKFSTGRPGRRDVTATQEKTFAALTEALAKEGFLVDHYHGVETVGDEEFITHFGADGFSDRWHDEDVSPQGWDSLVADEWHE